MLGARSRIWQRRGLSRTWIRRAHKGHRFVFVLSNVSLFVAGHGDFIMLGGVSVRRAWLHAACVEEREYTWWWFGVGKMPCQIPAPVSCRCAADSGRSESVSGRQMFCSDNIIGLVQQQSHVCHGAAVLDTASIPPPCYGFPLAGHRREKAGMIQLVLRPAWLGHALYSLLTLTSYSRF